MTAAAQEDIFCPLCDYNLRGLTEPRCPECGHEFDWEQLRQQHDQQHPYLFEHHRRRNLWSFFKTLSSSMLPRRFWRTLSPIHKPVVGRLIIYWVIISGWVVLALLPALAVPVWRYYSSRSFQLRQAQQWLNSESVKAWAAANPSQAQNLLNSMGLNTPPPPLSWIIRTQLRDQQWMSRTLIPCLLCWVFWPWLTFASLLIYRASMRQARIRGGHILRCAIYSADAGLLIGPILLLLYPLADPWGNYRVLSDAFYAWSLVLDEHCAGAVVLLLALLSYRLVIAYRRYLRFPHGTAAALASQVITGLALLKLLFIWFGY